MIEVRNLKIHRDIPFEEYLKIPGKSFSGIAARDRKREFTVTSKMRFGSQVDCYLTTPSKFKLDPEFTMKQIRNCAICIKTTLADVYQHLEFQLSITADFIYEGFVLHYKGRPDATIKKTMILDFKLTEGLNPLANYNAQVSGYGIALDCPLGFLVAQHPKKDVCDIHKVKIDHTFWEQACLLYGETI